MEIYQNIDGDSGVLEYECGADYIKVKFSSPHIYVYTYASAGRDNVEQMKILAMRGDGLNSFINRIVKRMYAYIE